MSGATRVWVLVSLCFVLGFLLILGPTPSALAAVDCEAKPNHPQCGCGDPPPQSGRYGANPDLVQRFMD